MKIAALEKIPLLTRILLILFLLLVISVVFIGLKNIPGIVLGMLAAATLVLELTRRWRRIRRFLFLAAGTFLGAVFLAGLYAEVALPLAERIGGPSATESTGWLVYHNLVSWSILLITPGGIVIGVAGAFILAVLRARALFKHPDTPTP